VRRHAAKLTPEEIQAREVVAHRIMVEQMRKKA
jgi:hypothetical protein